MEYTADAPRRLRAWWAGYKASVVLVDTHCHLNDDRAFPEPAAAVEEALAAGVARMVCVGVDARSSEACLRIADEHQEVYAAVGWHPNHASDYSPSSLEEVRAMLAHPKAVALGECGLDYYRDHAAPDVQQRAFRDQLALAAELGKPVVLHCREAYGDLLSILEGIPGLRLVFHCFSGSAEDLRRAVALGGWVGVDGPVTYRSAAALRALLATAPRERLLIETDAPWMAPEPHRGQRNKPAWLPLVNAGLASALAISEPACAELTTANAKAVFGPLGL